MLKRITKLLSLSLVVMMLFTAVVGCSQSSDVENPAPQDEADASTPEDSTPSDTPDESAEPEVTYDFGGRSVRLAAWWDQTPQSGVTEHGDNYIAKLDEMQEKYNFKIEYLNVPEGELLEKLTASNLGGVPFTDIIYIKDSWFLPRAVSGSLYPLSDLAAFDFNEDKWDKIIRDFSTWDGKQYGMSTGKSDLRGIVFWNKSMFEREGLPNLYELQNNHEWTWDKYLEIAQKLTKDLDGDGVIDQWGITGAGMEFQLLASNYADPIKLVDGKWKYNLTDPKAIEALQFFQDLAQKYRVFALPPNGANWDWHIGFFRDGHAGMMAYQRWCVGSLQSGMSDDFGIVAFPMGPQADEYQSELQEFTLLVMPSAVEKPEEIAIVYDEMTDPIPGENQEEAWRDGQLQNLRDEESLKSMEMIYDKGLIRVNRWFSFPEVVNIGWGFFSEIVNGTRTPATAVQEIAQEAQGYIDDAMGY